MPVTSAFGMGVPWGPVTWPVTVPLVGGGLGRLVGASAPSVLRCQRVGGELK